MVEFSGDVEEEFETDVDIDFSKSKWDEEKKKQLIAAIEKGENFCFKEVTVIFDGEVTIDVDPPSYYH